MYTYIATKIRTKLPGKFIVTYRNMNIYKYWFNQSKNVIGI